MPAYNFKTWKAEKVRTGESRQTIRPVRRRRTVTHDVLYLYHGQRRKTCELLRTKTCKSVEPVEFAFGLQIEGGPSLVMMIVNGKILTYAETYAMARADGFKDVPTFIDFFVKHYGVPNSRPLELIKW